MSQSRQKRRTFVNIDSCATDQRFQQFRQIRNFKKQKISTTNDDFDEKKVSLQNIIAMTLNSSQSDQSKSKFIEIYISTALTSIEDLITGLNMIRIKSISKTATFQQKQLISFQHFIFNSISSHQSSHDLTLSNTFIFSHFIFNSKSSQGFQQKNQEKTNETQFEQFKKNSVKLWNLFRKSKKALKATIKKKVKQNLRKKMK